MKKYNLFIDFVCNIYQQSQKIACQPNLQIWDGGSTAKIKAKVITCYPRYCIASSYTEMSLLVHEIYLFIYLLKISKHSQSNVIQ